MGELESVLGELVALANGDDTRRMPALQLPVEAGMAARRRAAGARRRATPTAVSDQDDIDALLASMAGGRVAQWIFSPP